MGGRLPSRPSRLWCARRGVNGLGRARRLVDAAHRDYVRLRAQSSAVGRDEHPGSPVKQVHDSGWPMLRSGRTWLARPTPALRLQDVALVGAFLVAYVALEWASFMHEHNDLPVTPWNPGLGIAFGLMILKGPLFGFALFAGVVLAETLVLQTELPWPIVLSIGAAVSASYAAAAEVARRWLRLDVGLANV